MLPAFPPFAPCTFQGTENSIPNQRCPRQPRTCPGLGWLSAEPVQLHRRESTSPPPGGNEQRLLTAPRTGAIGNATASPTVGPPCTCCATTTAKSVVPSRLGQPNWCQTSKRRLFACDHGHNPGPKRHLCRCVRNLRLPPDPRTLRSARFGGRTEARGISQRRRSTSSPVNPAREGGGACPRSTTPDRPRAAHAPHA